MCLLILVKQMIIMNINSPRNVHANFAWPCEELSNVDHQIQYMDYAVSLYSAAL